MACSKYTITNTGSTIVNFNYRRCDDSMWEYQVELLPSQTKNVWSMDETYSTAFYNNIEVVGIESWPPPPPIPCVTGEPLTDANINDAVALWFSDQTAAEAIYGGIECWNTTAVTDMSDQFQNKTSFNEDIGAWDVSNVTDMSDMFRNATSFNQDIGGWNVSGVINMSGMFYGATAFNQNIGDWDVSNVYNMNGMFNNAISFNQDISNWSLNSSAVDMGSMFFEATSFNQNLNNWEMDGVNGMDYMFYGATSFNNGGVTPTWSNLSNVPSLLNMFYGATSFNQNIGSWNIISVEDATTMFGETGQPSSVTLSTANYDALLSGWSSLLTLQTNVTFGAGDSQYTDSAAKLILTSAPNYWEITDGGPA